MLLAKRPSLLGETGDDVDSRDQPSSFPLSQLMKLVGLPTFGVTNCFFLIVFMMKYVRTSDGKVDSVRWTRKLQKIVCVNCKLQLETDVKEQVMNKATILSESYMRKKCLCKCMHRQAKVFALTKRSTRSLLSSRTWDMLLLFPLVTLPPVSFVCLSESQFCDVKRKQVSAAWSFRLFVRFSSCCSSTFHLWVAQLVFTGG